MNTLENIRKPRPVYNKQTLTAARVDLANEIASLYNLDRSKVQLPNDYAVLYGTDHAGNRFPLSTTAWKQADDLTKFGRTWNFDIAIDKTLACSIEADPRVIK